MTTDARTLARTIVTKDGRVTVTRPKDKRRSTSLKVVDSSVGWAVASVALNRDKTLQVAALVAEAAGAEKVWWCEIGVIGGNPAENVTLTDPCDEDPDIHDRCGWRWLLPATEEA